MRKIILYIASSLDGYIADKKGSVDFLNKYSKSKENYGYNQLYKSVNTIILGNITYKQAVGFGEKYEGKKVYVFSKKQKGKGHIEYVKDIEFVKSLKGLVWLVGGAQIIDLFMNRNLIDLFIITITPDVLGDGIPMFLSSSELKLISVKKFKSGLVQLHYIKNING